MVAFDGVLWHLVEFVDSGETVTRVVGVADRRYSFEVPVSAPVVLRSGSFGEVVPDARRAVGSAGHSSGPVSGPTPSVPGALPDTLCCATCGGLGFRTDGGRGCGCVVGPTVTVHLDADGGVEESGALEGVAGRSSVELSPAVAEERAELARRADPGCARCEGSGVVAQMCWLCKGIGWFWSSCEVEVWGPDGVVSVVVGPADLAPFAADPVDVPAAGGGRRRRVVGERADGVVDVGAWFSELAGGLAGGSPAGGAGELVVSGEVPGDAARVSSRFGVARFGSGGFLGWFGERFGCAAPPVGVSWPPLSAPEPEPRPVHRFLVRRCPGDVGLLGELVDAAGPVGFSLTGVATGQRGPVVYQLSSELEPVSQLACGYELFDTVLSAADLAVRGGAPADS